MSLKVCQDEVHSWVNQFKIGYWPPLAVIARLAEETGELAREVNHRFGPKAKKPSEDKKELGDEMADILFTLCCFANSQGINLDNHWKSVMDKCYGRDKDRFERKSEDS